MKSDYYLVGCIFGVVLALLLPFSSYAFGEAKLLYPDRIAPSLPHESGYKAPPKSAVIPTPPNITRVTRPTINVPKLSPTPKTDREPHNETTRAMTLPTISRPVTTKVIQPAQPRITLQHSGTQEKPKKKSFKLPIVLRPSQAF